MAKTEKRTVYIYYCTRTCFHLGKRWYAGSTYEFNQEMPSPMDSNFDALREEKRDLVPDEQLAYDIVGRETNRPSEYRAEV